MKKRAGLTTVVCLSLAIGSAARAETPAIQTAQKGAAMANHASGTFEVKVKPLPKDEKVEGLTVGRMSVDKQFKRDLEEPAKAR